MNYKEMILTAKESGNTSEKMMWRSIESISELLEKLKSEHPRDYWAFMRKQYGMMYNCHYEQAFAEYDVSKIMFTDNDGNEHTGAYWTTEQIEAATASMDFTTEVTRWDKYVAFNVAHSDFCKDFTDEQILQIAYDFFFNDEDWPGDAKIWQYMELRNTISR